MISPNMAARPTVAGRVSFVIPAGTADAWLQDAVASALASDHPDVEIIVVLNTARQDGFSLPQDPRVTVDRHPGRIGVAKANQRALELASGEFIAHLDADDVAGVRRASIQAAYLIEHPTTVAVGSRVSAIDETGRVVAAFPTAQGPDVRADLTRWNGIVHSSAMFRMESVRAVGGYDTAIPLMEDYDLLLRLALIGPIAGLPDDLVKYRIHNEQLSKSFRPFGSYMSTIMRRRRALADHVGIPRRRRLANDAWFTAVQWGMYLKGMAHRLFR